MGTRTGEQIRRTLERKPDLPKETESDDFAAAAEPALGASGPRMKNREARQSEHAISRRGMNQESPHNKHRGPPRASKLD